MAGYMTYWPGEQLRVLKKAGDTGPIRVMYGSIHSKMPSIDSVKVGDILYPVTVIKGGLCVVGRLPVEKKESAYDYLVRELGRPYSALIPDDVPEGTWNYEPHWLRLPEEPYAQHQLPFNCCSKTAVSGEHGSTIEPRPIPRELLPDLRFGWPKSKQKGLRFTAKGDMLTMCVATTRRLSDETWEVFESLFV